MPYRLYERKNIKAIKMYKLFMYIKIITYN